MIIFAFNSKDYVFNSNLPFYKNLVAPKFDASKDLLLFNYFLSFRQAIPGRIFPSNNSSDAPPPVEI